MINEVVIFMEVKVVLNVIFKGGQPYLLTVIMPIQKKLNDAATRYPIITSMLYSAN